MQVSRWLGIENSLKKKKLRKKIEKDEVKKEKKKRRDPEDVFSLKESAILVRKCPVTLPVFG